VASNGRLSTIQGIKTALDALDAHIPRKVESITSRSELAKHMGIERLVKRNRESAAPLVYV
jgi:hypothetical protein